MAWRPNPGPGIENNPQLGLAVNCHHPSEDDRGVRMSWKRKGLATLDQPVGRDPAAMPDERAVFVVTTPHETGVSRGDGVGASAAYQGGEHRVRIPARCTHPRQIALRSNQRAPLSVGKQGIIS